MKHRIYHSNNVRQRLGEYAARLGVDEPQLQAAYDWCIANNVIFESQGKGPEDVVVHIACLDIRQRIADPVARQLFVALFDEVPGRKLPNYGKNWPTLVDRMRRVWEQVYNILINKIPSHTIRVNWLRLGGAKIGKGSSIWRNTEVIGVESLTIGDDTCIGWHCQIDARSGLTIGDHATLGVGVYVWTHTSALANLLQANRPGGAHVIRRPTVIGRGCYIVGHSVINPGVTVGDGAFVLPMSAVTRDVAPGDIVAGAPAQPVGRADDGLVQRLQDELRAQRAS